MNTRISAFLNSRLQTQLLIPLVLLVAIPMIAVSAVLGLQQFNSNRNFLTLIEDRDVLSEQSRIEGFLQQADEDLTVVANQVQTKELAQALLENNQEGIAAASDILTRDLITLAQANGIYFKLRYLDTTGFEVVRVEQNIETGEYEVLPGTDKSDRPYFLEAVTLREDEIYISPLDLNREGAQDQITVLGAMEDGGVRNDQLIPTLRYAAPVYANNSLTGRYEVGGVVVLSIDFRSLFQQIGPQDNQQQVVLLNSDGYSLFNTLTPEITFAFEPDIAELGRVQGEAGTLQGFVGADAANVIFGATDAINEFDTTVGDSTYLTHYIRVEPPRSLGDYFWILLIMRDEATLLAPLIQQAWLLVVAITVVIVATIVAVTYMARRVTRPLEVLSEQAVMIADGNYNIETDEEIARRSDEIGDLNTAFHTMATQVQSVLQNLEARVNARTADLATSAEIAAAANEIRDRDNLISLSVNLIRDRFDFYYVQVYLVDKQGEYVHLADGTGYVGRLLLGRRHRLPLNGTSLVATAVNTNKLIVVNDTHNDKRWLPNELLPNTRAEIVVPLRTSDAVIGALDIQHSESDSFDEGRQQLIQTLADQISVTFENVRLLENTNIRARQMATVADVSIQASTTLDVDQLLRSATRLTRDNFGLYHAHVYLLDPTGARLNLVAGAGEIGNEMVAQKHRIALNNENSIVARAARTFQPTIENDVAAAPNFLPNPLLPDTRAEMALPMVVGDDLIGVLDVQSIETGIFSTEDAQVLGILASQLAVAIQNARSFAAIQTAHGEVDRIFNTSVDMLGSANFEGYFVKLNRSWSETLGFTNEELMAEPFISFVHPADVDATNAEAAKIADGVTAISFENRYRMKDGTYRWISWNAAPDMEAGLIHFVARDITEQKIQTNIIQSQAKVQQVLLTISNQLNEAETPEMTLVALAENDISGDLSSGNLFYIHNDTNGEPARLTTMAVWSSDPDAPSVGVGATFNLSDFAVAKVWLENPDQPLVIEDVDNDPNTDEATRMVYKQTNSQALAILPLYQQGQWVGLYSLSWQTAQRFTTTQLSIYQSIMRQATSVVQTLRATEQVQRRAAELETVANVSAATTTILNVDELLLSVVNLTKESFNLYHAHIYLIDEEEQKLVLAAGAGEAGFIMKEQGHSIHLHNENSIVARAARLREGVIANDVQSGAAFLPNPLLPETRSELAIPMIVGDELIGILDVQARVVDRFSEEDVRVKTTLADQVAVAVRNALAFERERRTVDQLKEVDRLKQEFLANMSHELRTPLNSIIGYSEVLLDGVDGVLTEDAAEDVEAIHSSGKHLLSIINEILDLAKIDAGQMTLSLKSVDLVEVMANVVKSSQILVKDKPVQILLEEVTPIPDAHADPVRIHQILLNLMGNAVKFTEEGDINVRYGMSDNNMIRVEVADSGVGMEAEQLSVIFERFRQVDGSSTRRAGGTGLGLTITKQLIEMHGGEVGVMSEPGVGTTFWFTLQAVDSTHKHTADGMIAETTMPEAGD